MTTLAANPAGTQGDSSACNIHHRTKNNAAAAAAATTMKPEADCERTKLFGLAKLTARTPVAVSESLDCFSR